MVAILNVLNIEFIPSENYRGDFYNKNTMRQNGIILSIDGIILI